VARVEEEEGVVEKGEEKGEEEKGEEKGEEDKGEETGEEEVNEWCRVGADTKCKSNRRRRTDLQLMTDIMNDFADRCTRTMRKALRIMVERE